MIEIGKDDVLRPCRENFDCVDYARRFLGALAPRENEMRLAAIIKMARADAVDDYKRASVEPLDECGDV